jgi:hypothetical protein
MPKQDAGYKLLFSHTALVRDFLRAYFPGDRSKIKNDDLEAIQKLSGAWIDERELLRRDNDIAWLCKFSSEKTVAQFVLLVEFQTHTDPIMPTRLATYSGLLHEELHRSGKMKSAELPMILPVVLYSGLQRWTSPTQTSQTRNNQPEALSAWQLDQKILLIDQLRLEETALPDTDNLVGLLIRIERSREPFEAVRWILQMDRRLFEMREFHLQKSMVSWLTRSFLPTRMPNITIDDFQSIQNIAMTIENNTIDWSIPYIEQGREQGREQGLKEGEAKGEARGKRQALQAVLQKQLTRKFGPLSSELISHIEFAEMVMLEKLAEEILDIESIDAVERFLNLPM